jgi:hypothetical protein
MLLPKVKERRGKGEERRGGERKRRGKREEKGVTRYRAERRSQKTQSEDHPRCAGSRRRLDASQRPYTLS